jgi:hypothetical protein
MGYTVLVSNFRRYFKLASYVSTFTDRSIVIAMGVPSLKVSPVHISMPMPARWVARMPSVFASSGGCVECTHTVYGILLCAGTFQ